MTLADLLPQETTTARGTLAGIDVIVSDLLPLEPTPGDIGRRTVRRGLAERLPWLAIDPGPEPEAHTHAILVGRQVFTSQARYHALREHAAESVVLTGPPGWAP